MGMGHNEMLSLMLYSLDIQDKSLTFYESNMKKGITASFNTQHLPQTGYKLSDFNPFDNDSLMVLRFHLILPR